MNFQFEMEPQNWGTWVPLGLALAAAYFLTRSGNQSQQISWQEFRISFLEKGQVERLEVVNRNIVRVYLRRDSGGGVSINMLKLASVQCTYMLYPLQGPAFLTFNIGSVDSFERNLELAQRELGIDPANQLPVTYVSEADWFKELLKLSPTLLILGALIYFSRRLSTGASGRGVSGPSHPCLPSVTFPSSYLCTQGIFGVGQSTAKMINKETNIKTKFR